MTSQDTIPTGFLFMKCLECLAKTSYRTRMNKKEQGTKLTNGHASPCRPPWRAAAPPPCTASTASTATEITTAITVALQYQTMCRNTVYFTCVACNGHHGLGSLRAVAVGGGADGVTFAQNLIVLFFFDLPDNERDAARRSPQSASHFVKK